MFALLILLVVAMTASGGAALLLERIAYRPLRKRNASRLTALITAIGVSLFLQELFALRYGRDCIGSDAGCWRSRRCSSSTAWSATTRSWWSASAIVMMLVLDQFVNRPASAAASGRRRRTPRPPC